MSKLTETLLKNLYEERRLSIMSGNKQRFDYLDREITRIEKQILEADEHETSLQINKRSSKK